MSDLSFLAEVGGGDRKKGTAIIAEWASRLERDRLADPRGRDCPPITPARLARALSYEWALLIPNERRFAAPPDNRFEVYGRTINNARRQLKSILKGIDRYEASAALTVSGEEDPDGFTSEKRALPMIDEARTMIVAALAELERVRQRPRSGMGETTKFYLGKFYRRLVGRAGVTARETAADGPNEVSFHHTRVGPGRDFVVFWANLIGEVARRS